MLQLYGVILPITKVQKGYRERLELEKERERGEMKKEVERKKSK